MNTSTTFVAAHRPLRVSRLSNGSSHTSSLRVASPEVPYSQIKKVSIRPLVSPREQEILHLIAYEHSTKEIAAKLFISFETVNSHRKNIMVKLGVKNTAGMVRVAFERQLLKIA